MEKDKKEAKTASKEQKDKGKKPISASSQQQTVVKKRQPASKDFRGVIRLAGKDMDGHLRVSEALRHVRGIGHNISNALIMAIERELSISPSALVGDLTEEQLNKIEEIARTPSSHGIPLFMLNRRRDYESGIDRHVLGLDLAFQTKQDLQREKDARSWIGWRHSLGQKVRGQHTRTTGRTGMTVGVLRKTIAQQAAAAKAEEKEKK